jgi:diguanylate cyclase (GGDEF)-like protein/PAS domain S-box-containing protein
MASYFVDNDRRITYWNQGAEYITGYSATDVIGRHCFDNILGHVDDDGRSLCFDGCPLSQTLHDCARREAEVYLHHKQGHRVPVSVRVAPIRDGAGQLVGAIEVFSNISAQKRTERRVRELEGLAFQDSLTEIPNRHYAELKVHHALQEVEQFNRQIGLLVLDLDHFKEVNDTYGHGAGDTLLRTVSRTIADNLRSENMVARWGGDEFLLIVKDIREEGLVRYAERLVCLIASSEILDGNTRISVKASIGATMVRKGETSQSAIKRADESMYKSKVSGRGGATLG